MKTMKALVKRNFTLFFKDKGVFFVSLITPLILLVLYVTFLGDVYRDVFLTVLPEALGIPEKVINGLVGGQLLSSLLAVSCVTVSFCANMLMVADKATGVIRDLTVTPVKPGTLAISYYLATLGSALTVNLVALAAGLGYLEFRALPIWLCAARVIGHKIICKNIDLYIFRHLYACRMQNSLDLCLIINYVLRQNRFTAAITLTTRARAV